jgi:hypothetical protein
MYQCRKTSPGPSSSEDGKERSALHVVGCAHQGVGCRGLGGEKSAESQVPQFDHSLRCDEHIRRLDICAKNGIFSIFDNNKYCAS